MGIRRVKFIAHRGKWLGNHHTFPENSPELIDNAIAMNFDVEVDVWHLDGRLWLGHNGPENPITYKWLCTRYKYLWVHAKNQYAFQYLYEQWMRLNVFFHETDGMVLTTRGAIWHYPTEFTSNWNYNSVVVMPEWYNNVIIPDFVYGICSDRIGFYREAYLTKGENVFQFTNN